MGRVYKVVDKEVHAKIALKLIRPDIAFDQATIERFRQELKTAREISHKNICRLHDLGRDGDTYFLTMEYVSGQDLKSMIAQSGQLAIGTAISIAKQVCDGLAEAHRLGVVHRDLKPQNIQIDKGGHAKIMDFGIARSVVAKGITDGGMAIGTPQYMSPEQAEARGVDARSDLYALGVILYEMLTGRVPFDADTPLAVAMKHKLEAPRDPLELNASIPADLGRLILKCLEKDKERRYQSASDVHADLVRIEQGLPSGVRPQTQHLQGTGSGDPKMLHLGSDPSSSQTQPSTSKQITLQFTKRQLLVPALVVVALVAVAFGAWRLWPQKASPAAAGTTTAATGKPMLAVLYFENISGDPALNTWRTGLPELLITSLSQSRLLNVVSSDSLFSILKKLNLADAKRFSAEDLAGVAKEGHAQYLLTGSVMKAGQSTVITARLQNAATGEVVRSEKIECLKEEEITSRVDELAKQIKGDLNLSPQAIAADIVQPAGEVLTSSPEALRFYTEARRLHYNGAYRDALPLYQRAIDVDPGFAMAYRGMASAYSSIGGERAKRDEAIKRALKLSDRLSERFRYQIQITAYSYSTATYPQLIDVATRLLAKYPDDDFGLNFLGTIRCNTEEYEKCAELREANVKVNPSFLSVSNAASVYAYLGQYDKRRRVLESYLERDPANARARVSLGRTHLITGQFQEALREADNAMLLEPRNVAAIVIRGDVALLRGDFAASEREYMSILDQAGETDRRTARTRLAYLCMTQGRFNKAREHAQASAAPDAPDGLEAILELTGGHPDLAAKLFQALRANPVVASQPIYACYSLWGQGLSQLAMGEVAGAQKALDDLKAVREGVFVKTKSRLILGLSGALAAKRGDGRTAVADHERAVAALPQQLNPNDEHAGFLELLAQACIVAGDLTKARETYEKITTLTTGRMGSGATYARAFYHLGVIAQQQGDKARAREQFQKFLDLWKDADKGLPEIAAARKRMGR